jgi:hypothetical protein
MLQMQQRLEPIRRTRAERTIAGDRKNCIHHAKNRTPKRPVFWYCQTASEAVEA